MPATIEKVRWLALGFPGVREGVCFGTPAFYVRRKLMLRLREDGETLVVRCPKEDRKALIDGNPDVFSVTDHYRNYSAILVNLLAVNDGLLRKMIEGAWRLQASYKQVAAYEVVSTPRQQTRDTAPSNTAAGKLRRRLQHGRRNRHQR